MNKTGRKLFLYFFVVLLCFAAVVFVGFQALLQNQMDRHHLQEVEDKCYTIKRHMEDFVCHDEEQGKGAYLKYLNDVTLAEVYIARLDGEPFTCGRNPDSEKPLTEEAKAFSEKVFTADKYICEVTRSAAGKKVIYAGIPIDKDEKPYAALVLVENMEANRHSYSLALAVLAMCMLIALAVSAGLSGLLARRFMSPIRRIAAVTSLLTSGNYSERTRINTDDEIGQLANQTDILASRLEYTQSENERLTQIQKDYISNISHELRTPIAVIRSSLEAFCDRVVPKEQEQSYREQILTETVSLQRLVDDMLEVSRLENADFPIVREPMDLLMALSDAVRATRMLAKEKNVTIFESEPGEEWWIEGDYGRIRQMFVLILDNAIKYSPTDSSVEIVAAEKPSYYSISVKDCGCGMTPEIQEHIFEKFYRGPDNETLGSGLGLAIVQSIAKRHEIQVQVMSRIGKGTKFTFIIPKNDKMTQE